MTYKNTRRSYTQNIVNEKNHAERILASGCSVGVREALNKNAFRAPRRSGFTLIELLVVVLIIGILAAVAVPQYQKAAKKSRFMKLVPLVHALATAEKTYYLEHGAYTDNLDALDVDVALPPNVEVKLFTYPTRYGGNPIDVWVRERFYDKGNYYCGPRIFFNKEELLCSCDNAYVKTYCKDIGAKVPENDLFYINWFGYSWQLN